MSDKYILLFILIYLDIYLLTVFHRGKLEFAKFLLGSVSLFLALFFTLEKPLTPIVARLVATATGEVGKITHMFSAYPQYGILFIDGPKETISLYIDYECAGLIEMIIFTSLIAFFPVYNILKKFVITIAGIIGIFCANIIRLTIICTIIYYFGNKSYYFAHTIFGRIVFYILSVGMYFYIFTRAQIKSQKVGSFDYAKDTNK